MPLLGGEFFFFAMLLLASLLHFGIFVTGRIAAGHSIPGPLVQGPQSLFANDVLCIVSAKGVDRFVAKQRQFPAFNRQIWKSQRLPAARQKDVTTGASPFGLNH